MKKTILLLIFILLLTASGFAGSAAPSYQGAESGDSLFKQANDLYEKGDYAEGIPVYNRILERGINDASLFYNLGNAYFRNNQLGRAILSYRRAARLSPRDGDIRFNLAHARSFVSEEAEKTPFDRFLEHLFDFATLNELAISVFIIYLATALFIGIYIFTRKKGFLRFGIGLAAMLLVFGLWLYARIRSDEIEKRGIVLSPRAEVRNGPGEDYSTGFTVPEGKEVIILEGKGTWYEIGVREKGLKGWIRKEDVEKI